MVTGASSISGSIVRRRCCIGSREHRLPGDSDRYAQPIARAGFGLLSELFRAILGKYRGEDPADLGGLRTRMHALLPTTEDLRAQSKYGSNLGSADYELLDRMMDCQLSMFYQISSLELAARGDRENRLHCERTPEIDAFSDGIEIALKRFAVVLNKKGTRLERSDLAAAIAALSDKNLALGEQRLTQRFALEEVLHFHTLLVGLENLANEADGAQPVAAAIASGPHRRMLRGAGYETRHS